MSIKLIGGNVGLLDLFKKKKEKPVERLGYGVRITKPKLERTYHHDVLDAIRNSTLIIPKESREKINRLLQQQHIMTFFIPREELEEDLKVDLLKEEFVKKIEKALNRNVIVEDLHVGLILAFNSNPEEKVEELMKKIKTAPLKDVEKQNLIRFLNKPVNENMAKELVEVLSRSKAVGKTRRKLFGILASVGAKAKKVKEGVKGWAVRVPKKPKPV